MDITPLPCTTCKVNIPNKGYKTCKPCLIIFKQKRQNLKDSRKCYSCHESLNPQDGVFCATCVEINKERWRNKRIKRLEAGQCTYCGEPVQDGYIICAKCRESCREEGKLLRDNHAETDQCERCNAPAEIGRLCKTHHTTRTNKTKKLLAEGLCTNCKAPREYLSIRVCLNCWFKRATRNRLKSYDLEIEVKNLWFQQQAKCALSGEPLIPGINAHLDHIIPVSRGGSHEIKNIRWIDATINVMKGNMLDSEFEENLPAMLKRLQNIKFPPPPKG